MLKRIAHFKSTMVYKVERCNNRFFPDEEKLLIKMEKEGFKVYQWSDSAGTLYSEHSHSEAQSHWIISGTLELRVEGFGKVTLGPGDRDFMPAGTKHSARVVGGEPVVYLIGKKA